MSSSILLQELPRAGQRGLQFHRKAFTRAANSGRTKLDSITFLQTQSASGLQGSVKGKVLGGPGKYSFHLGSPSCYASTPVQPGHTRFLVSKRNFHTAQISTHPNLARNRRLACDPERSAVTHTAVHNLAHRYVISHQDKLCGDQMHSC